MNAHTRTFRTLSLVVAAILAIALGACQKSDPPAADPGSPDGSVRLASNQLRGVKTETVHVTPFQRTVDVTGTVAFDQNRSTQVLAPISGPVAKILVDVGSRVHKGEALALVASPDFAADVSALRKASATATNAKRIADLDRQLFQNDAISKLDMQNAETDADNAEADRQAAIEQLRSLGVGQKAIDAIEQGKDVDNPGGIIRSPIEGTVVEKLVTPGQLLEAGGTPCFTVADLSKVWVMANVFESDLPSVAVGDPAEILAGDGATPLPATVQYVAAIVDPSTRAVAVRLVAANPGDALKRDQYVRTLVHSKTESRGILVPVSAVLRDEDNLPFVFVTGPDDTFARRHVEIGSRIGDRQEIRSGLADGDSIVVEGGLFLDTVEHQ